MTIIHKGRWIAGVVVLIIIVAAAAGSSSNKTTVTQTVPAPQTQAPAAPAPATPTPKAAAPKAPAASSAAQSFSGNGSKTLPEFTLASDSTMHWTDDGGLFMAYDQGFNFSVSSQAHSGSSAISAGTYRGVYVGAVGNWTISVVPGA